MKNNLFVYAVYDTELEKDYMPFFAVGDREAERQFMIQLMNTPDVIRDKMILNVIGSFDENLSFTADRQTISKGSAFEQWMNDHAKVEEKKNA